MSGSRKLAYFISALGVACFFLFPEPNAALVGTMLLETLAYVAIAGQSTADGIVVTGITILLMSLIPSDHPLVHGPFLAHAKPWIATVGAAVIFTGLLLVVRRLRSRI